MSLSRTNDGYDPSGSHLTPTVIDVGQEDLADLIAGMEGMSQLEIDYGKFSAAIWCKYSGQKLYLAERTIAKQTQHLTNN